MPRATEETQDPMESAVLVYLNMDESDDVMVEEELEGLCEAAGVRPVASIRQRLDRPHKGTYLGKGKVEEIAALAAEVNSEIVIVDTELSGIQSRNLQEAFGRRVIDRTQVILDIFARRARTKEGMLQV